jgi:hypothetical protein
VASLADVFKRETKREKERALRAAAMRLKYFAALHQAQLGFIETFVMRIERLHARESIRGRYLTRQGAYSNEGAKAAYDAEMSKLLEKSKQDFWDDTLSEILTTRIWQGKFLAPLNRSEWPAHPDLPAYIHWLDIPISHDAVTK